MVVDIESFVRAIPKAELHLHLEGAITAPAVVDLARKHGVTLPIVHEFAELYDFPDLGAFLKVCDLISQSVRDADDFHRITYEALGRATTLFTTPWRDFADPDHAISRMGEFGLAIMINTDDPGMFRTDLDAEYLHVAAMGFSREKIGEFALNGLHAAWLDDTTKSALLADWSAEIARAASP